MKNNTIQWVLRFFITLFFFGNLGCKSQLVAQATNSTPFSMGDGTVVDLASGQLFITTIDNKVGAIAIATGETRWTSSRNAKPLVIVGNRLICQVASPTSPQNMILAQFDLGGNGTASSFDSIALPTGVQTNLGHSAIDLFQLRAKVVGNRTYFGWTYEQRRLKGVREVDSIRQNSGALLFNVNTRQLNTITQESLPVDFLESIVPPFDQKISGKEETGQQFLSRDKQHILVSRKTATDEIFNNYVWEIYNSNSNQKIGEIITYRSYAPFFITGNILVYEEGPYVQRTDSGIVEVPRQLVAVNLQTGAVLWKNEIFDNTYRGPTPP